MQNLNLFLMITLLAIATSAIAQTPTSSADAEQPRQQQDAVREILELGGDWELPSKTVLISLIGDNFTNDTFQLLAPLVDVRHLSFFEVPADDRAFTHCKDLKNIEWLQITSCSFSGEGLKHFAKCKRLRHVYIEETPVTDDCLAILATFDSIETITIENWQVPSRITADGVRKLAALSRAKNIYIDVPVVPPTLEREMRKQLPNCEIVLTESPQAHN